jgi:hypothetical protein
MEQAAAGHTMATVERPNFPPVYDDLVELLARSAPADDVLSYTLSDEKQRRVDELLAKNRTGELTPWESAELDAFEHLEHVVRLLKARVWELRKA